MTRLGPLACWLLLGVGLLPLLHTVWVSFSPDSFLTPPTREWSWKWYRSFFEDRRWTAALVRSLGIAIASAVLSVLITLPTLGILHRSRWRHVLVPMLLLPGCLPSVALAMGLLPLLHGLHLWGTHVGLILIHTTVHLPIVLLILESQWTEQLVEKQSAARGLGATPGQVFTRVTLPLLRPAMITAILAVVVLSLNEMTLSIFLTTPHVETIASLSWPQLRFSPTPLVAVASTLVIIVNVAILLVLLALRHAPVGRALPDVRNGVSRRAT